MKRVEENGWPGDRRLTPDPGPPQLLVWGGGIQDFWREQAAQGLSASYPRPWSSHIGWNQV